MARAQELDRLFNPSSLAVIGAFRDECRGGGFLLKGLINSRFKGKLYPVNPKETEIMGLRSYPSILDIPAEVDLAIVAVPARTVPQVMTECGQKGVKFVVVHSAGFDKARSRHFIGLLVEETKDDDQEDREDIADDILEAMNEIVTSRTY